jgi:hypothetical protein
MGLFTGEAQYRLHGASPPGQEGITDYAFERINQLARESSIEQIHSAVYVRLKRSALRYRDQPRIRVDEPVPGVMDRCGPSPTY